MSKITNHFSIRNIYLPVMMAMLLFLFAAPTYSDNKHTSDNPKLKNQRLLKGHRMTVWNCAFSHDSKQLLSQDTHGTAILWNIKSGKSVWKVTPDKKEHSRTGACASISSDGRIAITGNDGDTTTSYEISIWDPKANKHLVTLKGHTKQINDAQFSADGSTLVSCSLDGTIRIWDTLTGKQRLVINDKSEKTIKVTFVNQDLQIISAGTRGGLFSWDVKSGELVKYYIYDQSQMFFALNTSRDDQYVATAAFKSDTVFIWDINDGLLVPCVYMGEKYLHTFGVAFSKNGRYMIAAGAIPGTTNPRVGIWDIESYSSETVASITGKGGAIRTLEVSNDGRWMAYSGEVDNSIHLWDISGVVNQGN